MTVLTLLGGVAVVVLVRSELTGSRWRLVAKPTASTCFVAVAVAAGATDTAYGSWVLVALVLSAIGDIALLGRSTVSFLLGLGSFLAGHGAYVAAFAARGIDTGALVVADIVLCVPAIVVIGWLRPHVPRPMVGPVVAYAAVISLMVLAAVGTVAADADARILVAAVAFYCSDLAVARDRFVAPGPANRVWGLPLYYAAQFLFAWTIVS